MHGFASISGEAAKNIDSKPLCEFYGGKERSRVEERVSISKFFSKRRRGMVEKIITISFFFRKREEKKEMRFVSTRWEVFFKECWR